eukprot:CAMPEP_0176403768 /NCGR_PEP_ID=MMETSP0126-20121128/50361_1 /TAXON_ID=141414 ORGANISM="Strombidinopsis acuminatum, Strain SPMC142" /NCGR_SAMPLE_ID=MMETSP0126 /ASSEMBLY_ACC=CAM_ASM_000229 /LENGTH=94 /DNA_ID=CAMNT_0017782221 /DNA_START=177 /DNA_END=461 /DNA_ORIENTATION=-
MNVPNSYLSDDNQLVEMKNTVIKIKSVHDNTPYEIFTRKDIQKKNKKDKSAQTKRVTMDVDLMLDEDTVLVDVRDLEMKGVTTLINPHTDSSKS